MGTKKVEAPVQGSRRAFLGKMGGAALALGAGALIGKGGLATASGVADELDRKKSGQAGKTRKQEKQGRVKRRRKGPVAADPERTQLKEEPKVRGRSPVNETLRSAKKVPKRTDGEHKADER